ncbi:MAG: ATP-binding cassette domain-containing protein, partial [Pseudomonadota bacterium]
ARQAILARSVLTAFGVFMVFTSVVGVLWIGARAVVTGDMTPGELGQFVLFAVFAAGALGELSQVWGEITLASGASERLAELLQMESDVPAPVNPVSILPEKRGSIAFNDVSFSYPNRPDETVVSSLSFSVEPGETVALVGPSGAGKSTIFQLLERFYDVDDGAVKIGCVDVRDLALKDLRDQFAMVPQQSEIFAASVSENLRFARPSATRDEIERAAHDAHIASFVEPMSEGYDTLIGERGLTLSAGQRQRIAIARAILRDAPILLLDEATSALDAESEALIQKSIARISQDRTTLIIAHRLATVRSADRILVLGSGGIIEEGSHQTLMARDGQYAKFARLQFLDWSNDNEVLSAAGS